MSDEREVKPCSSKSQRSNHRDDEDRYQGELEGSEGNAIVQDQLIIAPEVMGKILEHLNLRSLKQVRLVCKSWLGEAQAHMERRGIVRLHTNHCKTRVQEFMDLRQNKVLGLPQPFQWIDLDLNTIDDDDDDEPLRHKEIVSKLLDLRPPLAITRFSLGETPLSHAFPLIIKNSSTLESLELSSETCEVGYLPPMDPKQSFPKLRHLEVDALSFEDSRPGLRNNFPCIVAWIIKASPNLETYESRCDNYDDVEEQLASELLMKVDIRNMKSLTLMEYGISREAYHHLLSISFARLEHLKLMAIVRDLSPLIAEVYSSMVLLGIVKKSVNTLKILDMSDLDSLETTAPDFPLCPNVQELTLASFPNKNNIVSKSFPSLQILNIRNFASDVAQHWNKFSPLFGVKILRVQGVKMFVHVGHDCDLVFKPKPEMEFKVFEKFPSLERLSLHYSVLMRCVSRIASTDHPEFSNMLDGVKHLTIHGNPNRWSDAGFSSLSVLKGLETVTLMSFSESVTTVPVKELPLLKMIQFPWGKCLNFAQLLEMGRGVEEVIISNCCSFPRIGDPTSKELLDKFFDYLPNAGCGCGDGVDSLQPAHWNLVEDELVADEGTATCGAGPFPCAILLHHFSGLLH